MDRWIDGSFSVLIGSTSRRSLLRVCMIRFRRMTEGRIRSPQSVHLFRIGNSLSTDDATRVGIACEFNGDLQFSPLDIPAGYNFNTPRFPRCCSRSDCGSCSNKICTSEANKKSQPNTANSASYNLPVVIRRRRATSNAERARNTCTRTRGGGGGGLTREFTRKEFFGSSCLRIRREREERSSIGFRHLHLSREAASERDEKGARREQGGGENSGSSGEGRVGEWKRKLRGLRRVLPGHVWPTSTVEGSLLGSGIVYRITSEREGRLPRKPPFARRKRAYRFNLVFHERS